MAPKTGAGDRSLPFSQASGLQDRCLGTVRYVGGDLMELVKLETKLALGSAVSIVVLGIVVALLLFTGWILLISSLVAWVANDWLNLPAALLVVGLIVVVTVLPLLFMIKRHAGNLDFKATRRQLGTLHDEPPSVFTTRLTSSRGASGSRNRN